MLNTLITWKYLFSHTSLSARFCIFLYILGLLEDSLLKYLSHFKFNWSITAHFSDTYRANCLIVQYNIKHLASLHLIWHDLFRGMKNIFKYIYLIVSITFPENIVGKCQTDSCKRKEYTPVDHFYHSGKVLAVFDSVSLKFCIVRCRTYLECRSFNVKWINPNRTFGICTLLDEVNVVNLKTDAYPMTTLLVTVSCLVIY